MLSNGMGAIDWAGLPVVVEMLGIDDVEMLLERIQTIRSHRGSTDKEDPTEE